MLLFLVEMGQEDNRREAIVRGGDGIQPVQVDHAPLATKGALASRLLYQAPATVPN